MATTTSSLAVSGAPMKGIHAGVNSVYGSVTIAPTATASDVIKLFKMPDRAKFLSGKIGLVPGGGSLDLKVGYLRPISSTDSGSLMDNRFLLSTTGSATLMYDLSEFGAMGFQVSCSEDNAVKFFWIQAEVAAGGTHSLSTVIKFNVNYLVED